MSEPRRYVIWGSAGHAKVLAEIIDAAGGELAALVDNDPAAHPIREGIPLLRGESGLRKWLSGRAASAHQALVAIGGGRGGERLDLQRLLRGLGFASDPLVHAGALLSPSARLGPGCQILGHALVGAEAVLGEACIVNHKASVDHECRIGAGVHLAPGVLLCGCVALGDRVFVGAGATLLPRIRVGSDSVIGAGSLVTGDIPPGVVAYGRPAKLVKKNTSKGT